MTNRMLSSSVSARRSSPCSSSAFTLVELLVVIGVIALLVAILMPAVSATRRSASRVQCASNLREWAMAFQMFANVNSGYLPRRGQGVQPTNLIDRPQDWFNAVPPVLRMRPYSELAADARISRPDNHAGNPTIWICPEAVDGDWPHYWSYGMNMALSVESVSQNYGKPDKITGVGNASKMVLMTDAPGNYCSVYPSMYPGGYNPAPRHKGYVNIAFLDGHVAPFSGEYIGVGTGMIVRDDVRWHPPRSTWNSAR